MKRLAALIVLLCLAAGATAHESRPGYLELTQTGPTNYTVSWKIPRRGGLILPLTAVFPDSCRDTVAPEQGLTPGGLVLRRSLNCPPAGLQGQEIRISGLSGSISDVLVRTRLADGITQTLVLKPDSPTFVVAVEQSGWQVFSAYMVLGIEHILFGLDHLLFVLGLLLLVRGLGLLIKTITAFTVAHSLTLGAATLGFVNVPQAPVEAVIALSILFLATELLKQQHGESGLTERAPWLVAMSFGLLHGFGFAGALAEIGLPDNAIPMALLSFNLGVEAGQLLFVFAALVVFRVMRQWQISWPNWAAQLPAYGIGSLAAFWVVQRVAMF
ncbi:MAG: HupE/UreJ family protein [Gammaproteobacteria bacterium]